MNLIPYFALAYCLGTPPTFQAEAAPSTVTPTISEYAPKRVAVLLIDMQPAFTRKIRKRELKKEIPNMLDVLDYAGRNGLPVVVLEYAKHSPTIDVLRTKVNTLPRVTYVTKTYDDGFEGTGLGSQLRKLNVNEVVLMGINASACVASTSMGALENGFSTITSLDVIADPPRWGDIGIGVEGSRWFKRNATLAKDYNDLLRIITERKKGETL